MHTPRYFIKYAHCTVVYCFLLVTSAENKVKELSVLQSRARQLAVSTYLSWFKVIPLKEWENGTEGIM